MHLILTARHFKLPDDLRGLVEERLDRLERFEPRASRAEVTLTQEKNGFEAEAVVSIDRADRVHARADGEDVRSAVDRLMEKLAVQLRRGHDRHHRHQAPPLDEIVSTELAGPPPEPGTDEE